MMASMTLRTFRKGESLVDEGAPPSEIILTLTGECQMFKKLPDNPDGTPFEDDASSIESGPKLLPPGTVLLATLPKHTLVGEAPLLLGGGQPASVVAAVDLQALTCGWQTFAREIEKRPKLQSMLRTAAQKRGNWIETMYAKQVRKLARRRAGEEDLEDDGDDMDFGSLMGDLDEGVGENKYAGYMFDDDESLTGGDEEEKVEGNGLASQPMPGMGSFMGGTSAFFEQNVRDKKNIEAPPGPADWRNGDHAWLKWKPSGPPTLSVKGPEPIRRIDRHNMHKYQEILMPYPSITNNRTLHSSALPLVAKSPGFLDPVKMRKTHGYIYTHQANQREERTRAHHIDVPTRSRIDSAINTGFKHLQNMPTDTAVALTQPRAKQTLPRHLMRTPDEVLRSHAYATSSAVDVMAALGPGRVSRDTRMRLHVQFSDANSAGSQRSFASRSQGQLSSQSPETAHGDVGAPNPPPPPSIATVSKWGS
jgi:CRP-like cAMP-binding protein